MSVGSSAVPEPLMKVLLYGGAPFFCNPVKPFLNSIAGRSYARAYTHFRRDHQDPWNLLYHCFCLILQLGFNYSLLSEAGKGLAKLVGGGKRTEEALPLATSAAWSYVLLRSRGAPMGVRLASVGCLAIAHSQKEKLPEMWRRSAFITGFLEMLAVQVFVINKANTSGQALPMNKKQLAMLLMGRWLLQTQLSQKAEGCLSGTSGRGVVNAVLAAWMLKVSQDPFGTKSGGGAVASPFFLALVGWLLALLTGQPWLYFYSGGFLASMTQGVSHHYAGELSTLPQLADVSDELAHTTFFPNLLLHSVYQSLTSGRGPAALMDGAM